LLDETIDTARTDRSRELRIGPFAEPPIIYIARITRRGTV